METGKSNSVWSLLRDVSDQAGSYWCIVCWNFKMPFLSEISLPYQTCIHSVPYICFFLLLLPSSFVFYCLSNFHWLVAYIEVRIIKINNFTSMLQGNEKKVFHLYVAKNYLHLLQCSWNNKGSGPPLLLWGHRFAGQDIYN